MKSNEKGAGIFVSASFDILQESNVYHKTRYQFLQEHKVNNRGCRYIWYHRAMITDLCPFQYQKYDKMTGR